MLIPLGFVCGGGGGGGSELRGLVEFGSESTIIQLVNIYIYMYIVLGFFCWGRSGGGCGGFIVRRRVL